MSEQKNDPPKLPKTRLGNTGLIVSRPSLGCMMFGDNEKDHMGKFGFTISGRKESFQILDEYFARGGNFLDTANGYDGGGSEKVIGLWINKKRDEGVKDIRERVIVATKCFFSYGTDINQGGLSRSGIIGAVNDSLVRLQTDYIDLYICHSYDHLTPLDETLRTFDQLIQDGKIRYWGVSNWPAYRIVQAVERCRSNGWIPPCNAQMQYSLLAREIELDIVNVCIEYGIAITAWSPLASGWLTGKVNRSNNFKDSERAQFYKNMGLLQSEERAYNIIDKLVEVSKSVGKSPSQVAIRFLIDYNPKVQIIPIIGSGKFSHIVEGIETETFTLPKESIEALSEISKLPLPYPNNFNAFVGRKIDINYYENK